MAHAGGSPGPAWEPVPELLQQVAHIMTCSMAPDTALQKQAYTALEQHSANPEFARYLAYVFARGATMPPSARAVSGLTLKRIVEQRFGSLPAEVRASVRQELLLTLADGDASVRSAGANVISTIVRRASLLSWPELVPALMGLLESGAPASCDGALSTLTHLAEDVGGQFESAQLGHPLNHLIPAMIRWMGHPSEPFRRAACQIMGHLAVRQSSAMVSCMGAYMGALSALTGDTSHSVRRIVASSLATLVDFAADVVWPHLGPMMAFQLRCLGDPHPDVALAAAEFWDSVLSTLQHSSDGEGGGEEAQHQQLPAPVLRELVSLLLARMAFTDEDLSAMPPGDLLNDSGGGERAQDVRPHIHRGRTSAGAGTTGTGYGHGGGDNDDDGDDPDGGGEGDDGSDPHGEVAQWTVRKAAAQVLDTLAAGFSEPLLPLVLPEVQARLSRVGDDEASWRAREVGVLALGALASGCLDSMAPYAPQLWPVLTSLAATDARPLIRAVALWALSQYVPWLMELQLLEGAHDVDDDEDGGEEEAGAGRGGGGKPAAAAGGPGSQFVSALVTTVAGRVLDRNRKVQEAACGALQTLARDAPDLLVPCATDLVPLLASAFALYGPSSTIALLDAIASVADGVRDAWASPAVASALVPPIVGMVASARESDPALSAALEAATYLFVALGPLLAQAAPPLLSRALVLLENDTVLAVAAAQEAAGAGGGGDLPAPPSCHDFPLMVASLDLMGGVVEGVGRGAAPLLAGPFFARLHDCLVEAVKVPPPSVRQSAWALVGELAKHAPELLRPHGAEYAAAAIPSVRDSPMNAKVCNNAVWAVGEMAVALGAGAAPVHVVEELARRLSVILNHEREDNRGLMENAAITLGRLALVSGDTVAAELPSVVKAWTHALTYVSDPTERQHAYLGYCTALGRNPAPGLPLIGNICVVFAMAAADSEVVKAATLSVLQSYRANAPDQWAKGTAQLSGQSKQRLGQIYGAVMS